jgi:hypothetical protein
MAVCRVVWSASISCAGEVYHLPFRLHHSKQWLGSSVCQCTIMMIRDVVISGILILEVLLFCY